MSSAAEFRIGCYGCRKAADIGSNETVVGFLHSFLLPVVEHLASVHEKAMPVSRSKCALAALERIQPARRATSEAMHDSECGEGADGYA